MSHGDNEEEIGKEIEKEDNGPDSGSDVENIAETISDSESDENIKAKYDELYNRFIRLAADFDNYKKRSSKEKSDIAEYGKEELIRELLTVIDNLQLAIEHSDGDSENDIHSMIEGIKLVYHQFVNVLDKFGLKAITSSKGTEFDPRLHQAIERVETSEITPGLILDEMVRGYTLNERLLRPASVTVSTDIINKIKKENEDDDVGQNEESNENDGDIKINKDDVIYDLSDEDLE